MELIGPAFEGGRRKRQVRAAALTNYVEVARFVGLDPYAMFRRRKISPEPLADPEQRSHRPGRGAARGQRA